MQFHLIYQPGDQGDLGDYGRAVVILPEFAGILLPPECWVEDLLLVRTSTAPRDALVRRYQESDAAYRRFLTETPTQQMDGLAEELNEDSSRHIIICLQLQSDGTPVPNQLRALKSLLDNEVLYALIMRSVRRINSGVLCRGVDYSTVEQIAKRLARSSVVYV